jgi:hypothetical protein
MSSSKTKIDENVATIISDERFLRSLLEEDADNATIISRFSSLTPGGTASVDAAIHLMEHLDEMSSDISVESFSAIKTNILHKLD